MGDGAAGTVGDGAAGTVGDGAAGTVGDGAAGTVGEAAVQWSVGTLALHVVGLIQLTYVSWQAHDFVWSPPAAMLQSNRGLTQVLHVSEHISSTFSLFMPGDTGHRLFCRHAKNTGVHLHQVAKVGC